MADRDPAEQHLEPKPKAPESSPGLEDSIDKAIDNQSEVSPDDYPDKAGDVPL